MSDIDKQAGIRRTMLFLRIGMLLPIFLALVGFAFALTVWVAEGADANAFFPIKNGPDEVSASFATLVYAVVAAIFIFGYFFVPRSIQKQLAQRTGSSDSPS